MFLHPVTHEEYALARTERKTAAGYHGFQFYYSPDVTLEEDLARRDLTINAMARELNPDGELIGPVIDPFDGRADLEKKLFRHVGDAFIEDPVRILRLARFAARFADFTVAKETRALMKKMVADGEVDALVPERVWQEVSRGLMEQHAVAHVRRVARLRRARAHPAGSRCALGRAATRRLSPGSRYRRACDDGAGLRGVAGFRVAGALRGADA